jgi:hypothetical protein
MATDTEPSPNGRDHETTTNDHRDRNKIDRPRAGRDYNRNGERGPGDPRDARPRVGPARG